MTTSSSKLELSDEQKSVFTAILEGKNVLVTGSAGTGKSTLLDAIRNKYVFGFDVTATTGIAAVNVLGRTIHSWAGITPQASLQQAIEESTQGRKLRATARVKKVKILAVDEVSMLDASFLELMDKFFQHVRKDTRPFGGIQMIFFGDFLQLPPVRGTGFAFESPVWKTAGIETFRLTRVFRQEDQAFSEALNQIRVGDITDEIKALLNSRKGQKLKGPIKPVVVYSKNIDVDRENEKMLHKIKEPEHSWTAKDYGQVEHLRMLQNCLAPEVLKLKVGAQVMCLWNLDTEAGVANGSIGIVTHIENNIPTVQFANGLSMEIPRCDWQFKDGEKVLAGRSQFPLRLAYSITAHKCQGMTLDSIEVFLADCFQFGQAYVALSRCRTIEGLHISSIDFKKIGADPKALEFYGL